MKLLKMLKLIELRVNWSVMIAVSQQTKHMLP